MSKKIVKFQVNIDHLITGNNLDTFYTECLEAVSSHVMSLGWQGLWLGRKSVKIDCDYYGYDGGKNIIAVSERFETDAEYTQRLAAEKKKKENDKKLKQDKKEKELEQLKKLAKKHGKVLS